MYRAIATLGLILLDIINNEVQMRGRATSLLKNQSINPKHGVTIIEYLNFITRTTIIINTIKPISLGVSNGFKSIKYSMASMSSALMRYFSKLSSDSLKTEHPNINIQIS